MKYSKEEIGKIIKSERDKRNLSQKRLGDMLGISGKQISNYESGILIPPMDILIKLCDIYECELGFLLGEKNYSSGTKLMTAIQVKLGLDVTSINALHHISGTEKTCISFGFMSERNRRILNMFLSSPMFQVFFECLVDLDQSVENRKGIWQHLKNKYPQDLLDQAFKVYEGVSSPDSNALNIDDIIKDIDNTIGKDTYDLTYQEKVARYELNESFKELIISIYPKNTYYSQL